MKNSMVGTKRFTQVFDQPVGLNYLGRILIQLNIQTNICSHNNRDIICCLAHSVTQLKLFFPCTYICPVLASQPSLNAHRGLSGKGGKQGGWVKDTCPHPSSCASSALGPFSSRRNVRITYRRQEINVIRSSPASPVAPVLHRA